MGASFHDNFILLLLILFLLIVLFCFGCNATMGFEPAIPASKRLQTHLLDRAATGIGSKFYCILIHGLLSVES